MAISLPSIVDIGAYLSIEDVDRILTENNVRAITATEETLSIVYWEDKQFGPIPTSAISQAASSLESFRKIKATYSNGESYDAIYLCSVTGWYDGT